MGILWKEVFGVLLIIIGLFLVFKSVFVRDKITDFLNFIDDKSQKQIDDLPQEEIQVQQEEINVTYIISFGLFLVFVGSAVMTTPVMGKEIFGGLLALIGAISYFYKNNSTAMGFLGGLSKIKFIQGVNNFIKEKINKILVSDFIKNSQLRDSIFIKLLGVPMFVIGLLVMLIPLNLFMLVAGLGCGIPFIVKIYRKKKCHLSIEVVGEGVFNCVVNGSCLEEMAKKGNYFIEPKSSFWIQLIPSEGFSLKSIEIDGIDRTISVVDDCYDGSVGEKGNNVIITYQQNQ